MRQTSREQSTIDWHTNIVAWRLEREVRRDEHAQAIQSAGKKFRNPITVDQRLWTMEGMIKVAKVPKELYQTIL